MTRAIVTLFLLAIPLTGGAQTAEAPAFDARLLPWLGCWRAVESLPLADGGLLCVVPDGADAVRVLTIADGRVLYDESVHPDGVSRPIKEPGCQATRQSEWSADGLRIYARGTLDCARVASRHVSAMSFMTPLAEWVDAQVSTAGLDESVLVRR